MPLPGFWRFAWHLPLSQSFHPLPIYDWRSFSCYPGVESQSGWVCIYFKTLGPFKPSSLRIWQCLPPSPPLLLFTARIYGYLSSWSWNPGLCGLARGWDHLFPRYPSRFLSTTGECGTAQPIWPPPLLTPLHFLASPPHLCVSIPPSHLGECGFFKSLVVRFPYNLIF